MKSKLRHLLAPLMLISAFIVGFSCPFLHVYNPLVPWFVRGMLFLVFLQLDWSKMRLRLSHFGILIANLAIPLLFYSIFYFFNQPGLALGAFFAGIAPTGTACPALIAMLRLNVEYGVSAFVVTTLGVSLAIPLILPYLIPVELLPPDVAASGLTALGLFLDISFRIFKSVVSIVFLPLGVALLVRWFIPAASTHIKVVYRWTSFTLWVMTITVMISYVSFFVRSDRTISHTILAITAGTAVVICIVNFLTGYIIGPRGFKHESSQTLGQKNIMISFVLAQIYVLDPLAAIVPLCYIVCHNSWNTCQMICLKDE